MARQTHPTKQILIDTVIALLEDTAPEDITSEQVLEISRISRGSLYHHFSDFGDLIESALAFRYAKLIDTSIATIVAISQSANSREDIRQALYEVTRQSQSREREKQRFVRVAAIGAAANNSRLRQKLEVEQERLTDAIADLILNTQNHGWSTNDFDPRAAAVFIQSYTLGKILDDLAVSHVDQEAWNHIINLITDRVFGFDGVSPQRNSED